MEEFEIDSKQNIRTHFVIYLIINTAIAVLLYHILGNEKETLLGVEFVPNIKQTIAGTVFIALVIGTLMFWKFRVAIAFIGIVILLLTGTIDLKHTIEFMSLDVILFLVGMMILVGLLRRSGFFRWFLAKGLKFSKFKPHVMMVMFLLISAVMAALVDEVTSILFATALVLDFCECFKVKPVKLIIAIVFATNIGSSWTVLGNPIGILIALRSGLTFEDFLKTSFPIGIIVLFSIIVIILIWQRWDLKQFKERMNATSFIEKKEYLEELEEIKDRPLFMGSTAIFIGVIVLLIFHHRLELLLKLEHNTLLVASSILGAGIAMLWQRNIARELLMKEVDWWTLIFFMFLFAKAGALKYVGLTDVIGQSLFNLAGDGNMIILIILILWISGVTSAAADNVVVVATFIPVLHFLTANADSSGLWWALLFGGCYGGNMTMVGSTANIVALGILEDRVGYHMRLRYWIKIGLFGALIPMVIGTVALVILVKFLGL